MRITFEADSLDGIRGEIHAFLAVIEHGGSTRSGAGAPLPSCPVHLREMEFHAAGRGRNGKPVSASYRCPVPGCRGTAVWLDR